METTAVVLREKGAEISRSEGVALGEQKGKLEKSKDLLLCLSGKRFQNFQQVTNLTGLVAIRPVKQTKVCDFDFAVFNRVKGDLPAWAVLMGFIP